VNLGILFVPRVRQRRQKRRVTTIKAVFQ